VRPRDVGEHGEGNEGHDHQARREAVEAIGEVDRIGPIHYIDNGDWHPGHAEIEYRRLEERHVKQGRLRVLRKIDKESRRRGDEELAGQLDPCGDAVGVAALYLEPVVDEADSPEADEGAEGYPDIRVGEIRP